MDPLPTNSAVPQDAKPGFRPEVKAAESAKTPKKKGSCLKSCFTVLVVLLLVVGAFVANALGLPRKMGLVKSKAEKAFNVNEADRQAATEIAAVFEKGGIATKGMEIYVLPGKDGYGGAAYVVLDEAAGFSFSASADGDPFLDTLAAMARSEVVKNNGIGSVAFEYRDKQGRTLATVGARVQDGADFADKKITREQFMAKVGGRVDLKNAIDAQMEMLK